MKKFFLLTAFFFLLCSCNLINNKKKDRANHNDETQTEAVAATKEDVFQAEKILPPNNEIVDPNKVYCCAYDGFVNMRKENSYKSPKIGKFYNGPEGATLLADLRDWIKIEVDGLIGFVPSKYVQRTPTIAYTGNVTVDWIEGHWDKGDGLLVFNNGYWEYWANNYFPFERGYYIMQNNEVKFITVCSFNSENGNWEKWDCEENTEILQIDEVNNKLGLYQKNQFLTGKESSEELEEYGGSLVLTKGKFKSEGKAAAECVEKFLHRN